ncbi:sporulation protein [Acidovorax sp. SRB_14]|uniref:SPOR domain-containing protein n=2 Tax=unclassified Acidovorax TaxID=2684926 RepID=UPI001564E408|nr:SPOR domain-containing protein [Acidovorax sp. SRB_14]NMM81237.1 sporulation protein [Acidovorax sp. SRB_14]
MKKQQQGGTIVGFIFGLVVGLGAALAVAVYVTKVPVPFLNKGASRSLDQDAAEAQKNKNWDPNSPLYGKNPARTTAPEASGPVGAEAPPAMPPAAAHAPDAPAAAPLPPAVAGKAPPAGTTKAATSADPLGDLVKAKSKSAAAVSVDPFDYFVQAGAFRAQSDADAQRAKLAMMGWEARVSEREQNGRTVFRVRVGPFGKRDDAEQLKEKLDGAGVESALVRVQR